MLDTIHSVVVIYNVDAIDDDDDSSTNFLESNKLLRLVTVSDNIQLLSYLLLTKTLSG